MKEKSDFLVAFFASGRGSNFRAVQDRIDEGAIRAKTSFLLSNNSASYAIEVAASKNISTYHVSLKTEGNSQGVTDKMLQLLEEHQPDLLVLAGYMKRVPSEVIAKMKGRVLNIHPALLPAFGGQGWYGERVHQGVIDKGCQYTGMTVHLVNGEYDQGDILLQEVVPVSAEDTAESLGKKVIQKEHGSLWKVVQGFAEGTLFFNSKGLQGLPLFRKQTEIEKVNAL